LHIDLDQREATQHRERRAADVHCGSFAPIVTYSRHVRLPGNLGNVGYLASDIEPSISSRYEAPVIVTKTLTIYVLEPGRSYTMEP
jgi:hypothetical protein